MRTKRNRQRRSAIVVACTLLLLQMIGAPLTIAHDNVDQSWTTHSLNGYDWWIRYKWNTSFPSQSFKDYATAGANSWNYVGRDFVFVQDQNSPDILVKYESLGWPNDTSLGLETNIKQYGFGQIIGASLSFNSNYSWYAGDGTPGSGEYDVWSVAAHEFGHAVALNHSGAWYDTMYPYYDSGLGWRSLSWHDEDGISWLYYAH